MYMIEMVVGCKRFRLANWKRHDVFRGCYLLNINPAHAAARLHSWFMMYDTKTWIQADRDKSNLYLCSTSSWHSTKTWICLKYVQVDFWVFSSSIESWVENQYSCRGSYYARSARYSPGLLDKSPRSCGWNISTEPNQEYEMHRLVQILVG